MSCVDENQLSDTGVPFLIFAATMKDGYRKPMPGMWVALKRLANEAKVTIGVISIAPLSE